MKRRLISTLGILVAVSFIFTTRANAKDIELLMLPEPTSTYDGTPIASTHDDFWSYSAKIMTELYDYWKTGKTSLYPELGGFDFSTGTGKLDLLLYAGAKGQDNQEVGPDGPDPGNKGDFYFENPVLNPAGGGNPHDGTPGPSPTLPYFDGWWGQNDQNNDGTAEAVLGPVKVGSLLNYLHAFDPSNNIPVFYFDLNQTGTASSLAFYGRVYLYDAGINGIRELDSFGNPTGDDGGYMHEWAFDGSPQPSPNGFLLDGVFNPGAWVGAPGEVTWTGASGHVYTVNHNLGSGKPDFIAYAPSMNLGLYNPNYWFVSEFHMTGLNDGWEEIFLTGRIRPYVIPEPGTILLLGMGVLGLVAARRKKIV